MSKIPKKKARIGVDLYGRTPLWNLAFSGDLEGAMRELNAGADPNQADDSGLTPLHISVQERHADMVKLLLERKADPNFKDKHGNVPLWTAVHYSYKTQTIILRLLHAGADPRIENNYGQKPLGVLLKNEGEVGDFVKKNFG